MMFINKQRALFNLFKQVKVLQSLRVRLALWNVLILVSTLFTLGAIVYTVVGFYLEASLDKRLQTQGEKLQVATHIWLLTGHPVDSELFYQLAQSMPSDEYTTDKLYIRFFDVETGKLLQFSPNLQQTYIQYERQDFKAALRGEGQPETYYDKNGEAVRILTMPLLDNVNTRQQTIAVVQIGRSLAGVRQVQAILATVLCIGGSCATLIVYGISFMLTSKEIRPLSILCTKMKNLSVGGLGVRLEQKWQIKEIQLLTEAFNQMSQRLEASFTLQRNFVADVSHELRTPLTSIRGQIEVLLMNPDLSNDVSQDVQQIRAELIRLSHLVNNLLAMARVEAGILPEVSTENVQRVELDLLLVEIARQAKFISQHVSVELGQLQQLWIMGDKDALKQMLLNIVDNALTYTPPEGKVILEVVSTTDTPLLCTEKPQDIQTQWGMISVRDTGIGIAHSDLPHIFDRHYRATQTKSRSTLGAGIGLSLARSIAHAHGGGITVESALTKGSCFRIWLPLSLESTKGLSESHVTPRLSGGGLSLNPKV
jgi:two-component system OmpR family sensor kinase